MSTFEIEFDKEFNRIVKYYKGNSNDYYLKTITFKNDETKFYDNNGSVLYTGGFAKDKTMNEIDTLANELIEKSLEIEKRQANATQNIERSIATDATNLAKDVNNSTQVIENIQKFSLNPRNVNYEFFQNQFKNNKVKVIELGEIEKNISDQDYKLEYQLKGSVEFKNNEVISYPRFRFITKEKNGEYFDYRNTNFEKTIKNFNIEIKDNKLKYYNKDFEFEDKNIAIEIEHAFEQSYSEPNNNSTVPKGIKINNFKRIGLIFLKINKVNDLPSVVTEITKSEFSDNVSNITLKFKDIDSEISEKQINLENLTGSTMNIEKKENENKNNVKFTIKYNWNKKYPDNLLYDLITFNFENINKTIKLNLPNDKNFEIKSPIKDKSDFIIPVKNAKIIPIIITHDNPDNLNNAYIQYDEVKGGDIVYIQSRDEIVKVENKTYKVFCLLYKFINDNNLGKFNVKCFGPNGIMVEQTFTIEKNNKIIIPHSTSVEGEAKIGTSVRIDIDKDPDFKVKIKYLNDDKYGIISNTSQSESAVFIRDQDSKFKINSKNSNDKLYKGYFYEFFEEENWNNDIKIYISSDKDGQNEIKNVLKYDENLKKYKLTLSNDFNHDKIYFHASKESVSFPIEPSLKESGVEIFTNTTSSSDIGFGSVFDISISSVFSFEYKRINEIEGNDYIDYTVTSTDENSFENISCQLSDLFFGRIEIPLINKLKLENGFYLVKYNFGDINSFIISDDGQTIKYNGYEDGIDNETWGESWVVSIDEKNTVFIKDMDDDNISIIDDNSSPLIKGREYHFHKGNNWENDYELYISTDNNPDNPYTEGWDTSDKLLIAKWTIPDNYSEEKVYFHVKGNNANLNINIGVTINDKIRVKYNYKIKSDKSFEVRKGNDVVHDVNIIVNESSKIAIDKKIPDKFDDNDDFVGVPNIFKDNGKFVRNMGILYYLNDYYPALKNWNKYEIYKPTDSYLNGVKGIEFPVIKTNLFLEKYKEKTVKEETLPISFNKLNFTEYKDSYFLQSEIEWTYNNESKYFINNMGLKFAFVRKKSDFNEKFVINESYLIGVIL